MLDSICHMKLKLLKNLQIRVCNFNVHKLTYNLRGKFKKTLWKFEQKSKGCLFVKKKFFSQKQMTSIFLHHFNTFESLLFASKMS